MSEDKFIFAPVDLLSANLTPNELRVMLALYSFRGKNTNTVWPGRDSLTERSGISDPTTVSKVTSRLQEKGWLKKKKRGFTGGNNYELTVPEKVDDSSNVEVLSTMDKPSTPNVEETSTSNVEVLSTCKEHTIEQTKEHTNTKSADKPLSPAAIVDLYHEKLPKLPKVSKLTKQRKGFIQQRIREDLKTKTEWENYFDWISQSDFLMGRATPKEGQPPFMADLEWICRPSNYAKITEEKYHRG
ncbi:MAG: helix-turn-helix domain-containing protein [Flavobacteriales bacterium]